jgi:ABC-type Zn uptake system ZnuABC Zn-binding protein ZnuA
MAAQERALFDDDLDPLFTETDAVVTIARVWRDDLLYQAARARNIRVVPIDAARPWDEGAAPVGLRRTACADAPWVENEPCTEEISPFVWLSISNAVRMAEHIAVDLIRLVPDEETAIRANLAGIVGELRDLKSEYDNRFALLPDPRVFALADEFVYLFGEMGVFVDGYFTREDVRWTEEDIAGFEEYLASGGASVIVHKWEPAQPIMDAINRSGAKLVILDTADPGLEIDGRLDPDGYIAIFRNDLDTLAAALGG